MAVSKNKKIIIPKAEDLALIELRKKVSEMVDLGKVEELLGSNKLEFTIKEQRYRVLNPTFRQKQIINEKRIEKYQELLQAKTETGVFRYKTEDDLIKLYKERGIDIKEMDKQFDAIEKKKNDLLFQLGQLIKDKKSEDDLKVLRNEIQSLYESQQEIYMKKAVLLDSSLETQVNIYVYTYLAFLITEKSVNGEWVKAWNTYEEFLNCEEQIINTTVQYSSLLSRSETPTF